MASSITVLGLGLATTAAEVGIKHSAVRSAMRGEFDALTMRLIDEAIQRVELARYLLHGARGVFAASEAGTEEEFEAYAQSRDLPSEFPGVVGLGFLKPSADGACVVTYAEPMEWSWRRLGENVAADPVLREALERAVDTGSMTLSGRSSWWDPEAVDGDRLAMFVPVYKKGTDTETVSGRRSALAGVLCAEVSLSGAVRGAASAAGGRLDFEIIDDDGPNLGRTLFDFDGHTLKNKGGYASERDSSDRTFCTFRRVDVGGRRWTMSTSTTPAFDAGVDASSVAAVAWGGGAASVALSALIWALGTSRARAVALAERMTIDLRRQRDRAEAAVREFEALRHTLDRHTIVSVADRAGRILDVNSAFCEISGYSRDELIGQDHRILNSGVHDKSFWVEMWRTVASGVAWRGEVCNRAKDGRLYWVDSIVMPFLGADGRVEQYVSIRHEVTARREAEEALVAARDQAEAAARAKSEFLANMSHEIRTPMTAILGYAQLLAEEGDRAEAPPHRLEFIETIQRNGEHLLALINDILDLSKIEAGKLTVERIATDPGALLSEVEALMRVKAREKGLTLEVVRETELPATIQTDPVRLKQVMVNLVGNAIKFTEVGGVTIRVGLDRHAPGGPLLRVEVADTGIGMSPEQVSRLFGAFEQADASTTRRFGGTGLGLRISQSLALSLGGGISVRSEAGIGSVFELTVATGNLSGVEMLDVPARATGGSVRRAVREGASTPLAGMRVWLAEDGPDNQRLISYFLTKAGAEVRVFANGRAALEAMAPGGVADASACDVLLTDMQMPEMDGYSLARALRAAGWAGPIVALTAHAMSGDAKRCLDAGCDAYASKPIDRAGLIRLCVQARGRVFRRAA